MPDDDTEELDSSEAAGGARSLWSGAITFGLLSLAVDLFPAVRTEALRLKLVDAEHRLLSRRYFCPQHERFLSRDEIVRGYELGEGEHVLVTDEELESLAPEKSRAIDLRKFVDIAEIDPMYFKRSYLLTPAENEADRAYRLLAETMERSGRAGIATFVMRGKEYLVALVAEEGVLRAETLRFRDELRRPEDAGLPFGVEPAASEVQRYRRAISELAADEIDRAELADTRVAQLRSLIESKLEQGVDVERAAIPEDAETEAEIIDLMEVLKRRLQPEQRERVPEATESERAAAEQGEGNGSSRRGQARASRAKGAGPRAEAARARVAGTKGRANASPRRAKKAAGSGGRGNEDLERQTRSELYERAKALGVPGRSKMDKDQLVRALLEAGA